MDRKMNSEQIAQVIVDSGAYKTYWDRPKDEWPVSEQGRICPAYCNLRTLIGNVAMRQMLQEQLAISLYELPTEPIDVVCGVASAGVPWATLASDRLNMPMCYTRPTIKPHGERNGIEGNVRRGMSAVIVDDVLLTGNTLTKTSLQLAVEDVSVAGIAVLLRLSERTAMVHQPGGAFTSMPVEALCDYTDLIGASIRNGDMTIPQGNKLASYYQNPETQPWD